VWNRGKRDEPYSVAIKKNKTVLRGARASIFFWGLTNKRDVAISCYEAGKSHVLSIQKIATSRLTIGALKYDFVRALLVKRVPIFLFTD
jgi:hypothetical protein